jgi:hypothetical protein
VARDHSPAQQYRKATPDPVKETPDTLLAYYERFGLSAATVKALGIYRTDRPMPWFEKDGSRTRSDGTAGG